MGLNWNGHSTHWTSAGLLLFDWSPVVCLYFKAININQDRNRKVKASGQWRIKEHNMTFHLIVIGKFNLITGELANRKLWNVLTFLKFEVTIRGLFIYFHKISQFNSMNDSYCKSFKAVEKHPKDNSLTRQLNLYKIRAYLYLSQINFEIREIS